MAAYPHTPQEIGGAPYIHFKNCYESLLEERDAAVASATAVKAVKDYLLDDALSGEFARQSSLSMNSAYEHFNSRLAILERLETGENPQDILAAIKGGVTPDLRQEPPSPSYGVLEP